MGINTHKNTEMKLKVWGLYFENTNRDSFLNAIGYEFSHTRLEKYVESLIRFEEFLGSVLVT